MQRQLFIRSIVVCLITLAIFASPSPARMQQDWTAYDNILYYGPDVVGAQLDVYIPTGVEGPYPTVVYVTPPAFTDENQLFYYVPNLIKQGYAAVGIRIRSQHISPDSFCGMAWVHANAAEYEFDPQRIVAFGISGSGIPVATFATIDRDVVNPFMEDCPNPEPEGAWVQGVVAYEALFLAPVGLAQELIRRDSATFSGLPREKIDALYDLLIETPPSEWRDIEDTDYQQFLQGFPLYWLDGSEPPFLLIYGSSSLLGWIKEEQQTFMTYLEDAGVSVALVEKEGLGHSVDALVAHAEEMDAFLAEIFEAEDTLLQALEPITPENVDLIEPLAAIEQVNPCDAVFSPVRDLLAYGANRTITLWDTAADSVVNTLQTGGTALRRLAFSADGTLIAATAMDNLRVWNAATGASLLEPLADYEHIVSSVALNADGTKVAASTGCAFDMPDTASVRMWDTASGAQLLDIELPSFVNDVSFSPDGTLLAAAYGRGNIGMWDVATGTLQAELHEPAGGVASVAFSPDGTMLASGAIASTGADVRLWDVASGEQRMVLDGPLSDVGDIAFSADGRLIVAGGGEHHFVIWDTETGAVVAAREVGVGGNYVYSVAFNGGGTLLATCEHDGMLRLWGIPAGK